MATQTEIKTDNLTTDACPSPPREDNKSEEFEEKVAEEPTSYERYKKKKPKSRKSATHAIANVINISNANGIHIGSNYTINVGNSRTTESSLNKDIPKTEAISKLLEQKDPVTKEIISFVSEHIGKNWTFVARTLGYSDGQLYQFQENNSLRGIKEVVYQILLDWIQNKPDEATVGTLFSTLWEESERDVVQRMAQTNKKC